MDFFRSKWSNWQKFIIFWNDMSASTKIDNQKKDILILGKAPMLGLGEYSLPAEKKSRKELLVC